MRSSEYYAAGIRGFFVGFGLDAIEQSRHATVPPAARPPADRYEDDFDFDPGDCTGCSCRQLAPCWHCENNHDETGSEVTC